jgi:membrane protease YdiL (CAAX protease family)
MQFVRTEWIDVFLFALYCIAIGLFEEIVFRGILFSVLAGYFSSDKKGLWKTFVISSVIFGGAHLFNLFYGAGLGGTLLQALYTTLTGSLFAFAFIKTKNILVPAIIHGVYNFCGLLLSEQGLGAGAVLDLGTGITMAIVGVVIGVFVLYSMYKHPEQERVELYRRLNIKK